ncbi:hypothetical protein SAMN05720606_10843 [Paenibacillus polysaccharolyticus]|uniref:Uncharacterized protein n=1 Tax=Paenibacillus polysaccharolyticus TaxID=582692 RepID=A0A1G5I6H1_9BACL|nr:hypothetical protein SAMN05720606_10843 [Paenibacillus polysaccharolyticus]
MMGQGIPFLTNMVIIEVNELVQEVRSVCRFH